MYFTHRENTKSSYFFDHDNQPNKSLTLKNPNIPSYIKTLVFNLVYIPSISNLNRVKKSYFFSTLIVISLFLMVLFTPDLSRQDLEMKYAASPSQFQWVNGLRVHFRDTGNKKSQALVLLHGFGSSLQTWDQWAGDLDRDFRVVRLDLAGFGLTGASPDNNYSDQADVKRLANFLNQIGVENPVLVGHSMGGRIAWNFASEYPDRVKKLILLAPDGFPGPGQALGAKPYDAGPIANLIKYFMPKFLVKKSLEPAFFDAELINDNLLNRYYDLLRAPTVREAILERMKQTINSDPVSKLEKITAPTLLLWGESDRMIPCSNSSDYRRVLANSQSIILPKASHLLQEENAEISLAYVLEFINNPGH